jgi:hypothetical protein
MTLDYLGARIWWLGFWDMVPSSSNHDVKKDKEHVLENPN